MGESSLINLPDVDGADYLLEILFDIGPVVSNGMGVVAISEQDIAAWQFNRQMRLKPLECEALRRLSKDYAAMLHAGTDMHCPPPYVATGGTNEAQQKRVHSAFKNLARSQRRE